MFIDINGDSLNVSKAQIQDPNALAQTQQQLQSLTGLTLQIVNNNLEYVDADGNGKADISTDQDGKKIGSRKARKLLTKAISNEKTVEVNMTTFTRSGVPKSNPLQMNVNPSQVQNLVNSTSSDLDSRTMGLGMTFLHEVSHTSVGGRLSDPAIITVNGQQGVPFGVTGQAVDEMNGIRRQMGSSFGQRTSYGYSTIGSTHYIPFSQQSKNNLSRGIVPANTVLQSQTGF